MRPQQITAVSWGWGVEYWSSSRKRWVPSAGLNKRYTTKKQARLAIQSRVEFSISQPKYRVVRLYVKAEVGSE